MSIPAKFWTLSACTILASMLCVSTPASAANVFVNDITGTGARDFLDTSIWPSGILPTTVDQAIIDKGDGINDYVYLDSPLQIQRFNIGNQATGGLELRSGAYLFLSQGGFQTNVGPGQPGFAGVGYLRIKSGATLEQSGLMFIGLNPLGTGTVTLEEGGTHLLGGALAVRDGIGTYNMLGGTVEVGDFFQVARFGTGTFNQSGGTLEVKRNNAAAGMFLASGVDAHGTYEISGGSITVDGTNAGIVNGNSTDQVAGGGFGIFRVVGSAPTINIATNYVQANDARYETVIGATGISPMNVGGDINLLGALGVTFTATPSMGQQFTIMNYGGTLTGTFGTFDILVDSPMGPNTVQLSLDYGTQSASSIVLTVDSLITPAPGDFNGDGKVNAADYVLWRKNPSAYGGDPAGYNTWRANFGDPPGSGSSLGGSGAVPEPGFLGLLSCAAVGAIGVCRRRRRVGSCVRGR
jgi:hypothetical protein